jgi:restriction system protein
MKWQLPHNSLFAILLRSPWWASALAGAGVFVAGKLFLPVAYAAFATTPFVVIAAVAGWRQLRAPSATQLASRLERIRAMPAEEFARALEEAFRREGYGVARLTGAAAELELTKGWKVTFVAARRWKARHAGVEPLRELDRLRRARQAQESIYVTAGELSEPARKFAAEKNLRVLEGAELAKLLG